MKTWWTQYRRSRQLDEAPAPSAGREPLEQLDARLRRARPATPLPPPGLHDAILRRVRRVEPAREVGPSFNPWRLAFPALAGACGLVVLGLVIWPSRPPVSPVVVANASAWSGSPAADPLLSQAGTATLSAGRRAASEAPAAVLAPLEREMALFESDLRQAAQLAMASLP